MSTSIPPSSAPAGRSPAAPPQGTGPAAADGAAPTFDAMGLHPELLRAVRGMGFTQPTPIQVRAIPPILAGRDVIGCAQTGTGKTAAFVLPILHRLLQAPSRGKIRSLIIAPTRELALQSAEHMKALGHHVPLRGAAIFGGVPMEFQIAALQRGVDIVSATPGRLLDHVYSGRIDFVDLEVFVLDEVDRMLDMGFLPDIERIISLLPPKRQNLVFSATMPEPILQLVHRILTDPVMIEIGQRSSPATGVTQAVYPVARRQKPELLVALVKRQQMKSVLVFMRTKIYADRVAQWLQQHGVKVSLLHGDRSQSQRLRALELFRQGRSQVMVATDIAARGLDIEDISHVINFDVPDTADAYVHRIGRAARAGDTGDAFTLMAPEEEPLVAQIEQALNRQLPRMTLPEFSYQAGPAERHPARHEPRGRHEPHRRPGGQGPPRRRGQGGPQHGGHRPRRAGHGS